MKPKLNKKMLRQIIREIKAEPRRFHMGEWIIKDDHIAPCRTAACIAGHAIILKKMEERKNMRRNTFKAAAENAEFHWPDEQAQEILGLTYEQAERLFYVHNWPAKFFKQYESVTGSTMLERRTQRAKIAINRIRHLLKTGE